MSENLQTDTSLESDDSETPQKKRKITKELQTTENKQKKNQKMSPLTLRRAYMPRANGRHPAAHPAAAAFN